MKKLSALIIFSFFWLYGSPVFSQDKPFVIEQPGISKENEAIFLSRVSDGKPLSLQYPQQNVMADSQLSDVWKGNRPRMLSSISKAKLSFDSFDFDFEFNNESFIIRHSSPFYGAEKGGFRIGNEKSNKLRKFFYRGKNKQSLVVFIPAFAQTERARGALLCPRDFASSGTRIEKASLQKTGVLLKGAHADVSAEEVAFLKNPIDFVLAQGRLNVTPGVAIPVNYFDQSYAKDSNVALTYKPVADGKFEPFKEFLNIALGIENYLSLHFSTGYKRISKQKALLYVKQVELPENIEVALQAKDVIGTEMETELKLRGISLKNQGLINTKVSKGECYLVLYQVIPIIHEYLKEDFVIPKEYLDKENSE